MIRRIGLLAIVVKAMTCVALGAVGVATDLYHRWSDAVQELVCIF